MMNLGSPIAVLAYATGNLSQRLQIKFNQRYKERSS